MEALFSSDSSDDEESKRRDEEEAERKLRENRAKLDEIKKRRREALDEEEARRFPKLEKIELPTLEEILNRKMILLSPEEKEFFRPFIPRVIEHFDRGEEDFRDKMKKFTAMLQLVNFINCRHERIVEKMEENEELQKFLEKWHKEIVEALFEMTSIPKETPLTIVKCGNAFFEAAQKAKKALVLMKDLDDFAARAEQARLKEEELRKKAVVEITSYMDVTDRLAEQLATCALDRIRHPPRNTSPPPPIKIHEEDLELLLQQMSYLKVDAATRYGNDVETEPEIEEKEKDDEEDDQSWLDVLLGPMDENGERTCGFAGESNSNGIFIVPTREPKRETVVERSPSPDAMEESDDDEVQFVMECRPTWEETLNHPYAHESSFFGRPFTDEDMEDWKLNELMDKHKRKMINTKKLDGYKRVKFAPFHSDKNRMRVFVKPNGHFFYNGDDGPQTDYIDLSLTEGYKTLVDSGKYGFPMVVNNQKLRDFTLPECEMVDSLTDLLDLSGHLRKFHGNVLGRFWFERYPGDVKQPGFEERCVKGYLRQYTQAELVELYKWDIDVIHILMRRGFYRLIEQQKVEMAELSVHGFKENVTVNGGVKSVLLLTDWRLAHLKQKVLLNAHVKYMPTNLGGAFFETMSEYLRELLTTPNIEINTIIFAFGGSPRFQKNDFLKFFKALTVRTLKRVDVFWTAQDWLDGLVSTEEDVKQLDQFNRYVKGVFQAMNDTQHLNYKWCNIRDLKTFQTPTVSGIPDTYKLNPLYTAYIDHFVDNCNCYVNSFFFYPVKRPTTEGYMENDSKKPHRMPDI